MRVKIEPDTTITDVDLGFMLKHSGEFEVVDEFWMPVWVEWTTHGYDGPDLFARIEVRDGKPELVQLQWSANQYQRAVRQRDLRTMEVGGLVDVLYAGLTFHGDPRGGKAKRGLGKTDKGDHPPAFYAAQSFIDAQRRPKAYQVIDRAFLEKVAEEYRSNIDGAPTRAVANTFGVSARMASVYVDKARTAGLLPQTSQGRKNA